MAAFRSAVSQGLSPSEFWNLTPYLTRHAIVALADYQATGAWLTANFTRAKKMPELKQILSKQTPDKAEVSKSLKAAMMQIGKRK